MQVDPQVKQRALQAAHWMCKGLAWHFRHTAVYDGPVAIAGGWVRDSALGIAPKDIDIFVDGNTVNLESSDRLAELVAVRMNMQHTHTLKSYGTWAKDVDLVAKLKGENLDADLIVLRADSLRDQGYHPKYGVGRFGHAVLARVDLRLNAIGATEMSMSQHRAWDADVELNRLVIQRSRMGEDMARIDHRLRRLSTTKFAGWGCYLEDDRGEAEPYTVPAE